MLISRYKGLKCLTETGSIIGIKTDVTSNRYEDLIKENSLTLLHIMYNVVFKQ